MDISKLSEQELKALAFDFILQCDQAQANLNAVLAELKKRAEAPKDGAKAE